MRFCCAAFAVAAPPNTPAEEKVLSSSLEGVHPRVDPFYWLRSDSRSDRRVLAHLEAENAYAAAVLKPTEGLQEELFNEMVER